MKTLIAIFSLFFTSAFALVTNDVVPNQSYTHQWTDGDYNGLRVKVTYYSQTDMEWRVIATGEKTAGFMGMSSKEKYIKKVLAPNIVQISWYEGKTNKIGVILTYDFNKKVVNAVIVDPKNEAVHVFKSNTLEIEKR